MATNTLNLNQGLPKLISYGLGSVVLLTAAISIFADLSLAQIANWMREMLGISFISLFLLLVTGSLLALMQMYYQHQAARHLFWLETGLHCASGLTTLALTFTLLGISLGIGGLAEQNLTPETVQDVIRNLTAQFSLAFMTTVIGLPSAALLRAALFISHSHLIAKGKIS